VFHFTDVRFDFLIVRKDIDVKILSLLFVIITAWYHI